ncbi:hypothetical protein O7628_19680 [Micromonospora sp. WMMD956]|uniref:hypothetical protein n=1 Tax=Micromonospora TaxID=1873 RepID=UPI002415B97E|nr:hypothetical protein [Micromonospora sp. WMMD956]MDG4817714.1 hypothetical protein [Micromonospora sp. WMMD956]
MAQEDLTRDVDPGGRGVSGPLRRAGEPVDGRTRSEQRRLARARQRRRWAVEGLVVVACLVALGVYAAAPDGPAAGPDDEAVLPAPAGRPSGGFPVADRPGSPADAATPGLRPRQRTPTAPPPPSPSSPVAPQPAAVHLDVAQADVPAAVDLTAAGTRDWVHWGLRGPDSTVRKRDGSGEIADEGGRGDRVGHDVSPETFSWRDGAPVTSSTATTTGVSACGVGSGFALAVDGGGEARTVRLYAGLWMARGRLEARLSDGGGTAVRRLEDPHTTHTTEFTVRFRAPKGTKLLLTWTVEATFGGCGNVNLQAVALR